MRLAARLSTAARDPADEEPARGLRHRRRFGRRGGGVSRTDALDGKTRSGGGAWRTCRNARIRHSGLPGIGGGVDGRSRRDRDALAGVARDAIVLVNPGVSVSTADIFRRLVIREAKQHWHRRPHFVRRGSVRYLGSTRNDLEAPARAAAPIIGTVLDALTESGAIFVRMSGSGATCFGLFDTPRAGKSGGCHREGPVFVVVSRGSQACGTGVRDPALNTSL